jgi:hypothetical protein
MKEPNPKLALQHAFALSYEDASAMKKSLVQVSPSKKKSFTSQEVGAGVTIVSMGAGVGSGVIGEGLGGSVLHSST